MGWKGSYTETHLDNSAKVMLATGLIVGYGYVIEAFMGWYSGNRYEAFTMWKHYTGLTRLCIGCCGSATSLSASFYDRRNCAPSRFCCSLFLRWCWWACGWSSFMIVVMSLHRDFLTSSWGMYYPVAFKAAGVAYVGTSACSWR